MPAWAVQMSRHARHIVEVELTWRVGAVDPAIYMTAAGIDKYLRYRRRRVVIAQGQACRRCTPALSSVNHMSCPSSLSTAQV